MSGFWRQWLLTAGALAATAWALPGVEITSILALAIAAVVIGFLNAVVKPVVVVLTLPVTVVTLGFFYLVLNGLFFGLAARIVPGFDVHGFGSAFLGAIVMSIMSWLIGDFLPSRDDE